MAKSKMKSPKVSAVEAKTYRCVIMRGVSGSGKSTYIAKHCKGASVCSADDFFLEVVGEGKTYSFDPKRLGEAHSWCMRKFLRAVTHPDPIARSEFVVVDNTNTMLWEFMGYVQVASAMGYEVEVVEMKTDPAVAAARNTHGVPASKVADMARRFQYIPPFINVKSTIVKGQ